MAELGGATTTTTTMRTTHHNGRAGVELKNEAVSMVVLTGGGHIVSLTLATSDGAVENVYVLVLSPCSPPSLCEKAFLLNHNH
jgi:hypothetical protein